MNILRRCFDLLPLLRFKSTRGMSYKTVKRLDFSKERLERKLVNHYLRHKHFALSDQLKARIKFNGPITLAEYMKEVLINPMSGYYMSKDVFGQQGDFITSPEINQIFGEIIAIWCLTEYQKLGSPLPLQIVELGPGRGTLLHDILRVISKFKIIKKFSIELVEISPFLSQVQAKILCANSREVIGEKHYREGTTVSGITVRWYRSYDEIPDSFTILLAHEFFDALPIHKLIRDGKKWREVLIDICLKDENKFRFIQSREETPISKLFSQLCYKSETRDVVELCLEADRILRNVGNRFEQNGGIGLIMDYGHFGEKGDTFRVRKQIIF